MDKYPLNNVTSGIIGAAIDVHRALGPGLLESASEVCLVYDLIEREMKVEQQKPLPLIYLDAQLDCGYRIDLLVNDAVIIEIKLVDSLAPIHQAQLLSYVTLSGCEAGLLINFNVKLFKQGIVRTVYS